MFRRERETLQKLVLVPYRPFRNLSLGIGGVVLIAAIGVGGFYAGSRYGIQRLRQTVRMFADRSQALRDEAAVALHDREIVLDATEQLRQDNKNLIASMAALEEQVALYKRLLSPQGVSQGLSVERFELQSTGKSGQVQYRLLLTQVGSKTTDIKGKIEARLVAGGKTISMPVGDGGFTFQYFQSLTGEWQLPAGMAPERVDIVLISSKGQRIQKSFKWEVKGQG